MKFTKNNDLAIYDEITRHIPSHYIESNIPLSKA